MIRTEPDWYDSQTISDIDDMVEHIEKEYDVKLFDSYNDTFSGNDKEAWKEECIRWVDNLVNELEAVKSEVKAVE